MEEAANAVRLYVEAKPFENDGQHRRTWIERLDDCLADIRSELAEAAQDDGLWAKYMDMTEQNSPPGRSAPSIGALHGSAGLPSEQGNGQ